MSNFSWMFLTPIFFQFKLNCSNLLDMRNLQEQVKKAFCYHKLFWLFTVWTNCSSDLKTFANSHLTASNFKSFSRSLEQFFLTVGQKRQFFFSQKTIANRKSGFVKTWDVHVRSLSSYYPLRFQPSSRPNLRPRSRRPVDPGDRFGPGDPRCPCSLGLRWSAGLSIWTLKAACGLTF